eukprot:CAMPEP_0176500464 /NCGR_PEP_ID=MMETSP0200_2-20121128/13564_1 /TAXON_ID=947934 /ORGANISM="Chaetoceros sp., Strain GSL56" /LENGTH=265 /DNA_ID=CAMNT_0017899131 /DNA_START=343 /DNA_END=1142 /DNA_ORIENTATION=-
MDAEQVAELRKKRAFRKFTFRGIELDQLLDLTNEELMGLITARARRRMTRGLKRKPLANMDAEQVAELRKKRAFRKFTFRGIELDQLLDLTNEELMGLITARARRRMTRGLKRKGHTNMDAEQVAELRKKRAFRKFTFRGIELDQLLDLTNEELMGLITARARRRMTRGLKRKPLALIKRLRQAKKEAAPGEKPRGIKTHLRDMIIVPEMIGSIIGIYNGKMFCGVEMKPEMIGMYLGEFAITYKPVRHGRPGVSAAHQTRFIPL